MSRPSLGLSQGDEQVAAPEGVAGQLRAVEQL
jgi:hypothetical protein